ncbi:unnamed protein product [Spirodela intermedia]|uniref:Protein kinase domain-containing protein n=1 Tax=Spirodela intermedia TaxID=51605 RepID=A0A7I8L2W9_SPIIN|nr:unnamed protein product [Spirodela intermedia]
MSRLRSFTVVFFLLLSSFLMIDAMADADILLMAKAAHLDDPYGRLREWVPSSSPCNWTGVGCSSVSGVVIFIDLSGAGIFGGFPSEFCRISTLRRLSLGDNFLNGTLPTVALSPCSRLRHLNLSSNLFVGSIPELSPPFNDLQVLDLAQNNFSGEIPASFGVLPSLRVLNLFGNLLSGKIPPFLGNLSELEMFNLAYNPYEEGPLPAEIGNLTKLVNLWLPFSSLIGEIPKTIGNLERLTNLDLSHNKLTGKIPTSMGRLKSIVQIELYENRLTGELPESLGNLTSLLRFDASENGLRGTLPERFTGLHLTSLALNDNLLEGRIPRSLAANPSLVILKLFNNNFSGEIPAELGRNSDLILFDVSTNNLVGGLPKYLCNGGKLDSLIAFKNKLSGELSSTYGSCTSLKNIRIFNNMFSGEFPKRVWGLPRLTTIEIYGNLFEGSVSPLISQVHGLTKLLISGNNFSGDIPVEICNLRGIVTIDAGSNRFSGEVPSCIAQMKNLQTLELQGNLFSGMIPVGAWPLLTKLNLSRNRFSGEIPGELADLPVLTYLDLSENSLIGEIPPRLGELKLNYFNLSDNDLAGRVPAGLATKLFLYGLLGNPGLCSDANLSPIPTCSTPLRRVFSGLTLATMITAALLLASALAILTKSFWKHRGNKGQRPGRPWMVTSFHRVGFDMADIIDCMTEENLIGTGSSGRVYRGRLKTGQAVAVKRLLCGRGRGETATAARAFCAEVEALGRARHRNIVNLLFSCAAEGTMVLVYEYMENGSLGEALHGEKGGSSLLGWSQRAKIAVGAAQGLAYLHYDCDPPIIHRDIKSNNILLDGDYCARVGDLGLARTMQKCEAMSHVAGSCGYIAPGSSADLFSLVLPWIVPPALTGAFPGGAEYAYTLKVDEKSDVYSFGVVLLELVTGRRPVDAAAFGEGRDIVKWAADAVVAAAEGGERAVALRALIDQQLNPSSEEVEGMLRVLDVALACTCASPANRPSMRRVVELLQGRRAVRNCGGGTRRL